MSEARQALRTYAASTFTGLLASQQIISEAPQQAAGFAAEMVTEEREFFRSVGDEHGSVWETIHGE